MSWEEISRSERICDCGKGKIIKIHEDDDWNRMRDKIIIDCEDCRAAEQERKRIVQRKWNQLKELNQYILDHYGAIFLLTSKGIILRKLFGNN